MRYFIDSDDVPLQWEEACLLRSLEVFASIIAAILISFLKGLSAPCSPVHKPLTRKQALFSVFGHGREHYANIKKIYHTLSEKVADQQAKERDYLYLVIF